MSVIKLKCVDKTLHITSNPKITSGGVNGDTLQFEFSEEWDGFAKTAIFYRTPSEVYNVVLLNNECTIPSEVLVKEGVFYFGVFGKKGTTTLPSDILKYDIEKGAFIEGQEPSEPTPNIYTQILTKYALLEALCNEINVNYLNIFDSIEEVVAEMPAKGFVNLNTNTKMVISIWIGTKAEYDQLTDDEKNKDGVFHCVYDEGWTVEQATIAQYASEDYSKGTIEERLTKLGFNEGAFVNASISPANLLINTIVSQGKHAIGNLDLASGIDVKLQIPSDFLPKEKTKICVSKLDTSSGNYMSEFLWLGTNGRFYNNEELTIEYEFNGFISLVNCGWKVA